MDGRSCPSTWSPVNYWCPVGVDLGLIPRCFSFDCSVVRFNPNRMAAPRSPPICPWLFRKARRMCSRSVASRVSSMLSSSVQIGSNSLNGDTSTEPCVRITDRSIKFSSSRTFPGQFHPVNASMVFFGMLVIDLFIRRANFCTKCSTSSGMSSRRSSQRRHADRKHVQPVIQIAAELISRTLSAKSRFVAAIKRKSTFNVCVPPSRSNS